MNPRIDTNHDLAFALFPEYLQVGQIRARSDVPVHISDIVAFPVLPHFIEIQAKPAKHRRIQPAEPAVDEVMGGEPKGPRLVAQLQEIIEMRLQTHIDSRGLPEIWRWRHVIIQAENEIGQGTATTLRRRVITSLVVIPSASPSKLKRIRCLSMPGATAWICSGVT